MSTTTPITTITTPRLGVGGRSGEEEEVKGEGEGSVRTYLTKEELQESFSFLPSLYELLSVLENRQGHEEITRIAAGLSEKLVNAASLLEAVPGADCTSEEQQELLETKKSTLHKKRYV